MARMLPDVAPAQLEHTSEEPVYIALRDQLAANYVVLHSYPWLRPWREDALAEGEADFVVVHLVAKAPTAGGCSSLPAMLL